MTWPIRALCFAVLALSCGGGTKTPLAPDSEESPREQSTSRPPDFELDTLTGGSVRLRDHAGKVILLDFWATYCDPCLASMPHLDAVYRKYQDRGFVVLGIAIDGPESVAQVRAEVAKLGVSFPILLDQETRVVGLYNPKTSAPFSVLIGRDGRLLKQKEGYTSGDAEQLERDVASAVE